MVAGEMNQTPKLKQQQLLPETMQAITKYVAARVQNMVAAIGTKQSPTTALMAEIVVLETKLDALMQMLEDGGQSFEHINRYMKEAAESGTNTANQIRFQMTNKR